MAISQLNLTDEVKSIAGFKISNSHFKLGSKIHIPDFYFAKRFFQNSFFVTRLSFIVAKFILENYSNSLEDKKFDLRKHGLTLVGYGMYSELLIGSVEKYLRINWKLDEVKINHDLINDTENLEFIKKVTLHKNIVIVVPIASTFTTTIKLEQFIKQQNENLNILSPGINILYVSDGDHSHELTDLEIKYGWQSKDWVKKEIVLKVLSSEENITSTQKYFLRLPTSLLDDSGWQDGGDCNICSPKELVHEKILFETDKTSVTPLTIFSYPKGRKINELDKARKFLLTHEIIKYIHYVKNENFYHFYIDINEFYKINKTKIVDWLEGLKTSLKNVEEFYNDTEYIIIFASGHYYNTGFVSLVNEILFGNSANIIHYDALNDDIQNFEVFYGKEINKADKIFFVDDVLTTGTTFIKTNYFLKHTRNKISGSNAGKSKGMDSAILLLNRTSHFIHENLKRKIEDETSPNSDRIYSFANIHLPSTRSIEGNFPLLQEKARYIDLACNSLLDHIKVYFMVHAEKLDEKKESNISSYEHLLMVEATHRIFEYLIINNSEFHKFLTYDEFKIDLFKVSKESPFEGQEMRYSKNVNLSLDDQCILKVLTQYPFNQYEPIKKIVFRWIVIKLDTTVNRIIESIKTTDNFSYEHFKDLTFLIRRAGLLNSNYLISEKFLTFIKTLQNEKNGITKLVRIAESNLESQNKSQKSGEMMFIDYQDQIDNLRYFNIFYTAQIKELILHNEERSINIEKLLKSLPEEQFPSFKQIIRMLKEENSVLISKFYEFLKVSNQWNVSNITENYSNEKIINILNQNSLVSHYRYSSLNKYYEQTEEKLISDNSELHCYLWLMKFFENETREYEVNLYAKTEFIMNKLKDIIDQKAKEFGGFFLLNEEFQNINDTSNKLNVVFLKTLSGTKDITEASIKKSEFLNQFLSGEKDQDKRSFKTVIEFQRDKVTKQWIDLYTKKDIAIEEKLDIKLFEGYNRIILLRINKRNCSTDDRAQGLVGFFFNKEDVSPTNVHKIKYLLLLRNSISHFIEIHHENNEFRDLQIALIQQRASLLTGHGKEMLIQISLKPQTSGINYAEIVMSLLLVQRLLLDKNLNSTIPILPAQIISVFRQYFKFENEVTPIKRSTLEKLSQMAQDIFAFPEIENSEDIEQPKINSDLNLSFYYSESIIRMLCFEIFVNAKKNRWLFTKSQPSHNGYTKNVIEITAKKLDDATLQLKLVNTGPYVIKDIIDEMNDKKNVKEQEESSGLGLIHLILSEFGIGKITFDSERIEGNFGKFIVYLDLKHEQRDYSSN